MEYLLLTKKLPIILLGKNYYAMKKNLTDPSLSYLITETSRMHKNVTGRF